MSRTRSLVTTLMSFSAAAMLALCGAGGAVAAPTSDDDGGSAAVASHTVTETDAADYWTPERMRDAIPGDILAEKALKRVTSLLGNLIAVKKGSSSIVPALPPQSESKALQDPTSSPRGNETPVRHIGKVFFTLGGNNYVCSGNSVSSPNKSTVSTAGHCLNDGPGAFATNFVFVPAYLNGDAPYGKWTARALYAPTQWSSSGNIQYDTGFAVMRTLKGQKLADVVGASGVEFNAARGLTYKAYGYPAAPPFDGESLKSCSGTATHDPYNPQFNTQGIPCSMNGGSSGGPWFIGNSSSGNQNTVNSYGYGSTSPKMYGPYWGSVIQQAYLTASMS